MKRANFIGAPEMFNLNHACRAITEAFGYSCYLVGSAIERRDHRDVDVRLILDDDEFDRLFPRAPRNAVHHAFWSLLNAAISLWLKERTGLPVDFQIQKQSHANEEFGTREHPRHALGFFLALPDAVSPQASDREAEPGAMGATSGN